MGVVKMIKDPAVKCDLESSLKPLPVSPRAYHVTKNASTIGNEAPTFNVHQIKSSYYNYVQ